MYTDNDVKKYFETTAQEFDAIYDNRGGFITRLANKVFRKGMRQRLEFTLRECGGGNRTILDVGCGPGRISLMLAQSGARVVGIDYSGPMIELAEERLKEYKAGTNKKPDIEFIRRDFLEDFTSKELFTISIALGVFDYTPDPVPILTKMKELTGGKIVASFPAKYAIQTPIRTVWLKKRNCPVYYYTEGRLTTLFNSLNLPNHRINKVKAGYMVTAQRDT